MKSSLVPALLVFLALGQPHARAVEVIFAPADDTTLFETTPFNNLGQSSLAVGTTANDLRSRALLRFDVSAIPTNAVIDSAFVHFIVSQTPSTGGEASLFGLHRFLKPWTEGTGTGNLGSPADSGEPTWTSQFHGTAFWSQPGGAPDIEYQPAASSSVPVGELGPYTIDTTPALVADVQAWVSGTAANHGWIMISSAEDLSETARRILSGEHESFPPLLQVEYSVPPSPQISSWAVTNSSFELRFTVPSTYCYEVEYRDTLTPGMWNSLTNFCAPINDVEAVAQDSAAHPQRFYRLRISGRVR